MTRSGPEALAGGGTGDSPARSRPIQCLWDRLAWIPSSASVGYRSEPQGGGCGDVVRHATGLFGRPVGVRVDSAGPTRHRQSARFAPEGSEVRARRNRRCQLMVAVIAEVAAQRGGDVLGLGLGHCFSSAFVGITSSSAPAYTAASLAATSRETIVGSRRTVAAATTTGPLRRWLATSRPLHVRN